MPCAAKLARASLCIASLWLCACAPAHLLCNFSRATLQLGPPEIEGVVTIQAAAFDDSKEPYIGATLSVWTERPRIRRGKLLGGGRLLVGAVAGIDGRFGTIYIPAGQRCWIGAEAHGFAPPKPIEVFQSTPATLNITVLFCEPFLDPGTPFIVDPAPVINYRSTSD